MSGNPKRINGRTTRIREEEGLGEALNAVGAAMDGHGKEKHGTRRWSQLHYLKVLRKCVRHFMAEGADEDSPNLHSALGVARGLMVLQLELERIHKSKRRQPSKPDPVLPGPS